MSKRDEDIARRFLEAEKISRKTLWKDKPKIVYHTTYCPKCQRKVEYSPRSEFRGNLKCPHCHHEFKLSRLEDFQ